MSVPTLTDPELTNIHIYSVSQLSRTYRQCVSRDTGAIFRTNYYGHSNSWLYILCPNNRKLTCNYLPLLHIRVSISA